MSQLIVFTVPVRTVSESNAKEYWRTRHRRGKFQRTAAFIRGVSASMERPSPPMTVTMTRLYSGKRMDCDNVVSACKHVRDGVADWIGIDDGDRRITWLYRDEKCARGEYGVRVSVRCDQAIALPAQLERERVAERAKRAQRKVAP